MVNKILLVLRQYKNVTDGVDKTPYDGAWYLT